MPRRTTVLRKSKRLSAQKCLFVLDHGIEAQATKLRLAPRLFGKSRLSRFLSPRFPTQEHSVPQATEGTDWVVQKATAWAMLLSQRPIGLSQRSRHTRPAEMSSRRRGLSSSRDRGADARQVMPTPFLVPMLCTAGSAIVA